MEACERQRAIRDLTLIEGLLKHFNENQASLVCDKWQSYTLGSIEADLSDILFCLKLKDKYINKEENDDNV